MSTMRASDLKIKGYEIDPFSRLVEVEWEDLEVGEIFVRCFNDGASSWALRKAGKNRIKDTDYKPSYRRREVYGESYYRIAEPCLVREVTRYYLCPDAASYAPFESEEAAVEHFKESLKETTVWADQYGEEHVTKERALAQVVAKHFEGWTNEDIVNRAEEVIYFLKAVAKERDSD